MIDLSKLTPAPWSVPDGCGYVTDTEGNPCADCGGADDAEFIALARNAFDVMMRRGWSVRTWIPGSLDGKAPRRFGVIDEDGEWLHKTDYWITSRHDPFTALVEADRWYREHVEGGGK